MSEYCTRCGRELVEVEEIEKGFDSSTGQRAVSRWLQCPKWPRNGFVYLLRGHHDSHSLDNDMISREYR